MHVGDASESVGYEPWLVDTNTRRQVEEGRWELELIPAEVLGLTRGREKNA